MAGIYSVSQISGYIESMFANDYLLGRDIRVRGEVSGCNLHQRTGHIYFTLKDADSTLSGVIFSRMARALRFQMKTGIQVIVTGRIIAYPSNGKYEIKAWTIEPNGESAAYERYLELKQRLREKGLFDPMYKMPLPVYPRTIGVVTSSSGAAVQDIIQTARRRDPGVRIMVYAALVQGSGAAMALADGIEAMQHAGVDVIIIGRGGGSTDDLEAFNDELLAEAIFASEIPVISAVGHAINESISDLVADAKAITPTEAAQKATVDMRALQRELQVRADSLDAQMALRLTRKRRLLAARSAALEAVNPAHRAAGSRRRLDNAQYGLQTAMARQLQLRMQRLQLVRERLIGLSPYDKLEQGYAFVTDASGARVLRASSLRKGQQLTIHFADGAVQAQVLEAAASRQMDEQESLGEQDE